MNRLRALTALLAITATFCTPQPGAKLGIPVRQTPDQRPEHFPARVIAACDFEWRRKDAVWSGFRERTNLPEYRANTTALRARALAVPSGARIVQIKPVSYPRLGGSNMVYFRYFLEGANELTLELSNMETGEPVRVRAGGLAQGRWAEAVVDFGAAGAEASFGQRVNDLLIYALPASEQEACTLLVDDVILYNDRAPGVETPEEPFPRRVIAVENWDPVDEYHPWTHEYYRIVEPDYPGSHWGAAEGLHREGGGVKRIRVVVDPPQAVGEAAMLRFRYHLRNVSRFQVMVFDLTDRDNRHIVLRDAVQGEWATAVLDFTRDGIKNNGEQTRFEPGSLVDDIFFLAWPGPEGEAELLIDDMVFYDAGN